MAMQLTHDHVEINKAVSAFQRKPAKPIPYLWTTRFFDWLAGVRDRNYVIDETTIDTPWLSAIRHAAANSAERERRDTWAIMVVLAQLEATLEAQLAQLEVELAHVEDRQFLALQTRVDDTPVTEAEELDAPKYRLARRQRAVAAAAKANEDRITGIQNQVQAISAELARLAAARLAHWQVAIARVHHRFEWAQRRAAIYTRAVARELSGPVATPMLAAPDWVHDECPNTITAPYLAVA